MDEQIGIMRRCGRCKRWEIIDSYDGLAKLCQPCMMGRRKVGKASQIRTLVITPAGRELLNKWRAEETPAA